VTGGSPLFVGHTLNALSTAGISYHRHCGFHIGSRCYAGARLKLTTWTECS
jgi:hypothetical protein